MKEGHVIADVSPRGNRGFRAFALASMCAWACAGDASTDDAPAPGVTAGPDSISLEDIRDLVAAVGAEVLFERVTEPSPYLTDLFGSQPVQPVRLAQIVNDLVPEHASIVSQEPDALTLDLINGPRVTFESEAGLIIAGNRVDARFARIEIRDSAGYPAEPVSFREALAAAGVAETYLIPNPYFAAEQAVSARMRDSASIEPVPVLTDTTGFGGVPHAAIIAGETHGGTGPYDGVRSLLESPSIDWIAIEMLAEDLQPVLDRYLETADDTEREVARAALLDYYSANWNTRGHEITANPAENPYFRLIDAARSLGKPVYALDTEARFILFRFGEFPLGSTVRDFVWASNVPPMGRGVVYGGSSHFQPTRRPNMLTFLRERFPDIALFEHGGAN